MNEFLKDAEIRRILKVSTWVLIALLVLIALNAILSAKQVRDVNYTSNTISVIGNGEATSTPDIATFSFSVMADTSDVASGQSAIAGKLNTILKELKDQGIEDKDIQTRDYSVYPKYTYSNTVCAVNMPCPPSRQIADGYSVSETVTVKVRKIDAAGQAIAMVGKNGATNISSLSLVLEDPNSPVNNARLNAIDDARKNAEAIAERLGVDLGKVVSYYDTNQPQQGYPVAMYDKAAITSVGSAPAAIAVGENKTTATVNVTFQIR
jgi:uncharacterized protein YggE